MSYLFELLYVESQLRWLGVGTLAGSMRPMHHYEMVPVLPSCFVHAHLCIFEPFVEAPRLRSDWKLGRSGKQKTPRLIRILRIWVTLRRIAP